MNLGIPLTNVDLINKGGSVEIDGHGTLMAKKSSILNRNPGISVKEAEAVFEKYLGVTKEGTLRMIILTEPHVLLMGIQLLR